MVGGFDIFFIQYALYYPDLLPTIYTQKILGKFFIKLVPYVHVFILYHTARAVRDFSEMLAILG
ncbi:hypothetical protein IPU53_16620 [Bacillus sp. SD088]|nr:hypothetical protein [Bacillus sp. SD088]